MQSLRPSLAFQATTKESLGHAFYMQINHEHSPKEVHGFSTFREMVTAALEGAWPTVKLPSNLIMAYQLCL